MSGSSDSSAWRHAHRLAASMPCYFTWPAKRRAISDLLEAWRQALIAGRR